MCGPGLSLLQSQKMTMLLFLLPANAISFFAIPGKKQNDAWYVNFSFYPHHRPLAGLKKIEKLLFW